MEFIIEDRKKTIDLQLHPHIKLSQIIEKTTLLQKLQAIFESTTEPALSRHCTIANFENGSLIVLTDSATWSTKIRFLTPELIEKLIAHPEFLGLEKIKCLVRPNEMKKEEIFKNNLTLTAKNAHIIKAAAKAIKDKSLRDALLRLAQMQHPG